MKKCLHCNEEIEQFTRAGKERKYCNKSCSRKHYIQNNRAKVVEANKRGYQTLLKENPDIIKNRGRNTPAKLAAMKKLNDEGHYSRMHYAASHERTPEAVEKWKKTMKENGHHIGDDSNWTQYRRKCRRETSALGSAGDGLEWDHIVPISLGYKLGIPWEKICSPENIQKLTVAENRKKYTNLTEEAKELLMVWKVTGVGAK